MARQRHPAKSFRKSPGRPHRSLRGRRHSKSPQPYLSPSKHEKGPVLNKPSLVRAKLQSALANKPIAAPLTDSDDSDKLVTKRKNVGKEQNPIYASGAVAAGDTPGAHPSRKRKARDNDAADVGSSPEKRRLTSGSGLKRPVKTSLRSPLAPILPNANLLSFPLNNGVSSSPAPASEVINSTVRPILSNSILAAAETSILGTLKPRKRQPSILQLIETNDSSRISVDDENEFLPDTESTPTHGSQNAAGSLTPASSLRRPTKGKLFSSGLRRPTSTSKKRDSDMVDAAPLSSSPAQLLELPRPSASRRRESLPSAEQDSIMAPPASSSPEAPPISAAKLNKAKKSKPTSTSTEVVVERLMSSSRSRRPQRRKNPAIRNEFDIPEDSTGSLSQIDGPSDSSDHSTFKPGRRKRQVRKSSATARPAPPTLRNRRGASVLSNSTANGKVAAAAISLSKNGQRAGDSKSATMRSRTARGGGARHLNITTTIKSSGVRGKGEKATSTGNTDKENRDLLLEGVNEDGAAEEVKDVEEEDELQRMRRKFAEVDGWDMEFEDVEVGSAGSEGWR